MNFMVSVYHWVLEYWDIGGLWGLDNRGRMALDGSWVGGMVGDGKGRVTEGMAKAYYIVNFSFVYHDWWW